MTGKDVWSNTVTGVKAQFGNKGGDDGNIMVFDCAALGVDEITVQCPNDGWRLAGLRVLSGKVVITSLYGQPRYFNFGQQTNEVYVAQGAYLQLEDGPSFAGPLDGGATKKNWGTLLKTGKGTLHTTGDSRIGGAVYYEGKSDEKALEQAMKHPVLHTFCLKEGTLKHEAGGDTICPGNMLRIAAGQTFEITGNDKIENYTVVHVEKGATFNLVSDFLGAVTGEGDVYASGILRMSIPSDKGPLVFGGRLVVDNRVLIEETIGDGDEERYLLIASSHALAGVDCQMSDQTEKPLLRFAPGIGTFHLKRYQPNGIQMLHLEDTQGGAICLHTDLLVTRSDMPITTGCGDLVLTGTGGYTFAKDALGHTGRVCVKNGYGNVKFGTGAEADDVDLSRYAAFHSDTSSGGFIFNNAKPAVVTGPVTGSGYIRVKGAPVTFDCYRPVQGLADDICADTVFHAPQGTVSVLTLKTGATCEIRGGHLANTVTSGIALTGEAGTSLIVSNAYIGVTSATVRQMTFKDGSTVQLFGGMGATGTAEEPQEIVFDDARLWFGAYGFESFNSDIGTMATDMAVRNVYVKEGGLTCDMRAMSHWHGSNIGTLLSGAAPGAQDGGVTVRGNGWLRVDGSWADLAGPVNLYGCYLQPAVSPFVLQGACTLGTMRFYSDRAVVAHHFGARSGSSVTLAGATVFNVLHGASSTTSSFVLGPEDAPEGAALTRRAGGVLFLMDTDGNASVYAPGYAGAPVVRVNGGLPAGGTPLSAFPVFTYTNKRMDGTPTSRYTVQFTRYDSEKGFVEEYGTPWEELETKTDQTLALVDSDTTVKVTEDTAVGALRVIGSKSTALEIAAGARLAVGAGTTPAYVLLNNTHAANRGKAIIGGSGTLDFGAREGVVAVNQQQSGTIPAEINCELAGTGGITFAAPAMEISSIKLGKANTYAGGTHIAGCEVTAAAAGCFGTGGVYVDTGAFYGGAVNFSVNGTWSNDFSVQGSGSRQFDSYNGVLNFTGNATDVKIAGSVTLADETYWVTATAANQGTFTRAIGGEGDLILSGRGTFVFTAQNTYRGKTAVKGAVLVLRGAGSLGDGPLEMDGATVRFENDEDVIVTNAVTGTGRIVAAGRGRVQFSDAAGFTGDFAAEGSGTHVFDGSCTMHELEGSGVMTNAAVAASVITLDNERLNSFSGVLAGRFDFVKRGAGMQELTGQNTYEGATRVLEGTLVLGEIPVSDTLIVPDTVFRLDATSGVACDGEDPSKVTAWTDADARGYAFVPSDYRKEGAVNRPTLMRGHINGRDALHFDHTHIRLTAEGMPCTLRTYFHVVAWGHDNAPVATLDGIFGQSGKDDGVRILTAGSDGKYQDVQKDWVNGSAGSALTKGAVHLFAREFGTEKVWDTPAVGDYSPHKRPFGGDMCEIMGYGRILNETERRVVSDYLMVKWGIKERPAATVRTNVLPAGSDLTVAAGAQVAFNAVDQTLRTLSGSGTLTNQTDVLSVVTLTEGGIFDGTIAPRINLVLKQDADLALGHDVQLAPDMVITAEPGASLDLGGATVHVGQFRGSKTQIVNGTLVQANPYSPGFVIRLR